MADTSRSRIVSSSPSNPLEVVIIGAGPSGLVSAKTLLEHGVTDIAILEETSSPGGLWNCETSTRAQVPCFVGGSENHKSPNNEHNNICIASSSQPVYQDFLQTNFPKDLSHFLGYPFPSSFPNFLRPHHVHSYYQGYVSHYGLDKVIHYHCRVIHCGKESEPTQNGQSLWKINIQDSRQSSVAYCCYAKRLLVCNGHFRKAFCPWIPGLQHFRGRLLHSSAFESPKDKAYASDQSTILIVGGYISGTDIASLLAEHGNCQRIVVSVRKWKLAHDLLLKNAQKKYPTKILIRPGIDHIGSDGRVFFCPVPNDDNATKYDNPSHHHARNGNDDDNIDEDETERPNVIIFCTGYRYYFPFLKPSNYMQPDGYKMTNLYKRILYVNDMSLAFIGITNVNLSPAIVQEYQAKWYTKMVVLDQCQTINAQDVEQDIASRANDTTQDALWTQFPSYCNSLAKDIGCRGYWMQLLLDRLPLQLKSLWVQRHPFMVGMTVAGTTTLLGAVAYYTFPKR